MQIVFSIYDSKAEAYLQPFFAVNNGVALRDFAEAANTSGSNLNRYGADFTLFAIADWDEFTGVFYPYEAKVSLGTALEHIRQTPVQGPPAQAKLERQKEDITNG